jgi:hypothetical protein
MPSVAATVQVFHVLQQFASLAYCGVAGPVSKIASQQEKAFCVLRFEVSRSVITLQREFVHSSELLIALKLAPRPRSKYEKLLLVAQEKLG